MLGRYGTFTGGIDLPDDKAATLDSPIQPALPARRLRVPLAPCPAPAATAVVQVGDLVERGQLLGEANSPDQADVYAPLAGMVEDFWEVMLPAWPGPWRSSLAVELRVLEEAMPPAELPVVFDWQADTAALAQRLSQGGLTTFRRPIVPLPQWLSAARSAKADVLIANLMENTPYATGEHRLLAERADEVVRGLVILARALGIEDVMLAVDHRRTEDYRPAVAPAREHGIETISLAHKYPIGDDVMLTKVLTGRVIPPGQDCLSAGVAIVDAATCWAVYRWVACGQPCTHRVVTVSGARVGRPGNFLLPFGTDTHELLAALETRDHGAVIYGPAMTGEATPAGAVVSREASLLLAERLDAPGAPTPCIRCGWCGDYCPARLNVSALNDDFELGRADRADRRGVLACVECGVCSYVCPARLPLARRTLLLKQAIGSREFGDSTNAKIRSSKS